ncbi:MAG: PAS domain S-box protein [bacterium]
MKPVLKAAAEVLKDNKDNKNNLPPPRSMNFIKNKIIYVLGILFLIIVLTGAVLIWRFGLIPIKHYDVDNVKLHLKFDEINKNIERTKTNTRLIIYYEKVRPLNYKNRLKKVLNKTKILIEKTDLKYKKTAAFIKKTAPYGNYRPEIVKAFKKAYFQWEIFGKPGIKRFIKHPVYIAPVTSYRLFSKYILLPVSSSVLPSKPLAEEALSYFEYIINIYLFVFILGTFIIIILGIILAYYFGKFLNIIVIEENERRLKTFFDKLPAPSFIADVKTGFIIDANEKASEFYGYSKEEFKHITIAVINPFISIEKTISFSAKALKEGYNFAVFKHKLKNGDIRDVEAHISGITYNDKPYVQAIIQDITEKIEAQNQVRHLLDFNAALAQINQLIAESTDEKEMLKSICEIAVKYAGFKVAHIGRPDENGRLQFLAAAGEVDFLDGIFISVSPDVSEGQGVLGKTWREAEMHHTHSIIETPNLPWKERTERFGIQSTAALPIYRGGKIWALFAIHHENKNIFNDDNLKALLEETAKSISRGLDNIDASIREHELMATQEALLGNTLAGISVTDRRRLYINLNNRFAEIFGYGSKDELLGQSARLLYFDDEEYNRVGEFYKNIFLERKTTTISPIYFKRKDGTAIWCEMSGSPVSINGQDVAVWTLYDITERKLLEDKLKESEELSKTLTDNLPVSLVMHKDKYIYANPEFTNMFGYTEQELQNMYFWEIDAEEYRDAAKERTKNGLMDINNKYNVIVQGVKKSGERLWMHVYANSAKYKGEIVRIASFLDITEMVSLRNALEQERDLFKVLIENIHSGIALYNYSKDKFLYINLALLDLFNYTKEEFLDLSPIGFFSIGEDQIYNIDSAIFKIHHNNELSSKVIYKYIKGDKVLYIDLFRTVIIYNNEQTGLAIFSDVTGQILKEQNILVEKEAYKELSEHDSLTGILNRRSFDDKLVEILNVALRYKRPLSLIMFDIDRFKNINDIYGHEAGDSILKKLSAVIKEDLRAADFFARYGGEEFFVIAPETTIETAKEFAERLRLKVESRDFDIGQTVTCSFGITYVKAGDTPKSIVYRADTALYEAKETGRNRVCTF